MGILKPLRGHVLIRLDAAMRAIESGIIIPQTAQRAPGFSGICIAGDADETCIGKRVMLETWAGRFFDFEGATYFTCKRRNVIAVVEGLDSKQKIAIASGTEYGVRRCRRCKSRDGEGNMILDGDGYCPLCGMNDAGDKPHTETVRDQDGLGAHKMRIRREDAKVNEEEIERLGGPAPQPYRKKIQIVRP